MLRTNLTLENLGTHFTGSQWSQVSVVENPQIAFPLQLTHSFQVLSSQFVGAHHY